MIQRRLTSRARSRSSSAALLGLGVISLLLACTATPKKSDKLCKPGAYVFCRCRDREEGEKLCKDDAKSFGPCEPCETADNPEGPLEPGDPGPYDPIPDDDGGADDSGSASCGDGVVQRGEDCDDQGDGDDSDGCDAACKLAGAAPSATNTCPGLDVHVWGGAHRPTLSSTTVGSGNRSVATACANANGKGSVAPDRVFKVTAHKTGTMTVATTDAGYDVFLYASKTCASGPIDWLACANAIDGVGSETMKVPVESGETYYVFVDGLGTSSYAGSFRVTFSIP